MKTLLILFLIFFSFLKGADSMKTVEYVNLERFMGKWFVIALVPNMIEKGATNSSDTYVLNKDGTIDILNYLGKNNQHRPKLVIGFSAETEKLLRNSKIKFFRKLGII